MSKAKRVLLGIATIWPVVYLFLFMSYIISMMALAGSHVGVGGGDAAPFFLIGFAGIFLLHLTTIFLSLGLMVYYIMHAVKSVHLDQTMRIVWVLLLCMMGMLAQPVYWYLYIWRDQLPRWLPTAGKNSCGSGAGAAGRGNTSNAEAQQPFANKPPEPHSWR
jgi:hypothetical protein